MVFYTSGLVALFGGWEEHGYAKNMRNAQRHAERMARQGYSVLARPHKCGIKLWISKGSE